MYATATNSRWTDRKQFSKLHQPLPTMILLHTSRESHFLTPSTMKGSENGFTAALPASAFSLFSKKKTPLSSPKILRWIARKKIRQCNYNKDIYIYIYIYILYTHYTILYVSVYIIYMYICDTLIIDTYRISYNMQVRKINNVGLPASSPTHGLISK